MTDEIEIKEIFELSEQGFSIFSSDNLEALKKQIDDLVGDPDVMKIITVPLTLSVSKSSCRKAYGRTPISIRAWCRDGKLQYDCALKIIRKSK
jgi:hypothetical protein